MAATRRRDRSLEGIEVRHQRSCVTAANEKRKCDCDPTYRPWVMVDGRRVRGRATSSIAEARGWRHDANIAARRGREVDRGTTAPLRQVVETWLVAAKAGTIRTRSGDPYKPSALRGYEHTLRRRVLSELGGEPIADIRRADLQELVDRWVGAGLAPATVQATIIPVKAIFRRELELDRLKLNPTIGLRLPAVRNGRDRVADPAEAVALLVAVPEADRAIWATAMYAGLRLGELRALRVGRIDLDAGHLNVEKGWDQFEGEIDTKGRNSRRVPIPEVLREHLAAHLLRTGRRSRPGALAFGQTDDEAFEPQGVRDRADEAWEAAELDRIKLHECRHTFASLMIAAGVNAKALCDYMGHSSIQVTYDKYGHLMPGNEAQAAELLDRYLRAAEG